MKIRQYCISGWDLFDPVYFYFTRLHHIKQKCGKKTIMRVRLTKYKGREVILSDGTVICKNDLLIKIHLHNVKLLSEIEQYKSDFKKTKIIYVKVKDSLPAVVEYIQLSYPNKEIKGLIGITTLYKGCKRLGFEPHPIMNPVYKKIKQIGLMPIYFLSKNQWNHQRPDPMYLFMSKNTLLSRYLKV